MNTWFVIDDKQSSMYRTQRALSLIQIHTAQFMWDDIFPSLCKKVFINHDSCILTNLFKI